MIAALIPWRWIAAALALAAMLGGAFYEGDKRGTAVTQAAWNAERAAVAMAGAKAQASVDKTHETQEAAVAASDDFRTKELSHEIADIDIHRAAIASGTERVRIVARCTAGGNDVRQAAGTASVDHGASVELAPADGQIVLDLRAAIASDQVKIKALQDYVQALQK